MRKIHHIISDQWREVLDFWTEGKLTDVVMTPERISVYRKSELIHTGEQREEDFVEFVTQTVPGDFTNTWTDILKEKGIMKYSFYLEDHAIVRAVLAENFLTLRFIPAFPSLEDFYPETTAVLEKRFWIESGGVCSGKTTRLLSIVRKFLEDPAVRVFVYEYPQEIYVPDARGLLVSINKESVTLEQFADLVLSSGATLVVFQSAGREEEETARMLTKCGIKVFMEERYGAEGREA